VNNNCFPYIILSPDAPDRMRNTVTMREQIYRAILRCGSFGATFIELAEMLDFSHDIVQLRTSELHGRARIIDSGRRRLHSFCDQPAIVWVLSLNSHSPVSEAFYGKEEATQPAI